MITDKNFTILIVDDAVENVKSLIKIFEDKYDIVFALGGYEALEKIEQQNIDIVLLDVNMPDMSGFEVLAKIRENTNHIDLPVIFVTSLTEESLEVQGLELGAVDYITKPISPSVVKARVKNHLTIKELKNTIQHQVEINRQKDLMLFQQSKLASMGEMLANIAHQWRQPLSVITTIASGIKLSFEFGIIKEKDVIDDINILMKNASYLSQTIDDFRKFMKNSNDSLDEFTINDAIYGTTDLLKPMINTKHIHLILNLNSNSKVFGSKNELVQAFINIISNVKDAFEEINSEQDRFLLITSYDDDENIIIEIADNAGGIKQEAINKIFDPYFTTKHQSVGTGIGLYMTSQIITKKLHGSIRASNELVEINGVSYSGAKFLISIPKVIA